jgi:hypothetical protein
MIRVATIIELAAKWTLMGQRKVGLQVTLRLTPSDGKFTSSLARFAKVNRLNLLEFLSEHHL